jgi:site-specific DNA-methyltransferase (adenine-specific)
MEFSHSRFQETVEPYVVSHEHVRPTKVAYSDAERGIYLIQGDCLEFMEEIARKYPKGCFDMIFADPPYRLSNGGMTCYAGKVAKVDKGIWDKSEGPELDFAFTKSWLALCQDVLKPNGTIWVSGTRHIIHMVGYAMQLLGFKILNDITWEKPNPPPNLSCRYFTHSTETLLWAAKSEKSKHAFNYADMREEAGGKQMKSVWQILPPAKDEKTSGKHPTQKPVALLDRCIRAATNPGDFILDPFAGSSTTGVAAIRNRRRYCGIEKETEFVDLSIARLQEAISGS